MDTVGRSDSIAPPVLGTLAGSSFTLDVAAHDANDSEEEQVDILGEMPPTKRLNEGTGRQKVAKDAALRIPRRRTPRASPSKSEFLSFVSKISSSVKSMQQTIADDLQVSRDWEKGWTREKENAEQKRNEWQAAALLFMSKATAVLEATPPTGPRLLDSHIGEKSQS
jgi:hypothetical protein